MAFTHTVILNFIDAHQLEGKCTEWPNPQISGENRQSGLTDQFTS